MDSHNAMVATRLLTPARKANPSFQDMRNPEPVANKPSNTRKQASSTHAHKRMNVEDEEDQEAEEYLTLHQGLQDQLEDDDTDYEPSAKEAKRRKTVSNSSTPSFNSQNTQESQEAHLDKRVLRSNKD